MATKNVTLTSSEGGDYLFPRTADGLVTRTGGTTVQDSLDALEQRPNRAYNALKNTQGYQVLVTPVDASTSFASQISGKTNTIFEIRDNFDLGGNTVTIPAGCTLKFEGGKISNGTVIFNDTEIEFESISQILPNCTGIIKNEIVYPEWFYSGNWKTAINIAVACAKPGATVFLTAEEYYLGSSFSGGSIIGLKDDVNLISDRYSRLYTHANDGGDAYYAIVRLGNNSLVKGILFDQTEEALEGNTSDTTLYHFCVNTDEKYDAKIQDCKFKYFANALMGNSTNGEGVSVDGCEFEFFRMPNMANTDYDSSAIYLRDGKMVVTNNRLVADLDIPLPPHGGIELHGYNCYCQNNVLINHLTSIYVTNDVRVTSGYYDDNYNTNTSVVIQGNTFKKTADAIALWAQNRFSDNVALQDISDVLISGNIGTEVKHVINFRSFSGQEYGYKNITLSNNYFSGNLVVMPSYDEIYRFRDNTAIFCTPSSFVLNFVISNNVFANFCGLVATGTSYTADFIDMVFENNVCKNVLNYTLDHNPSSDFPPAAGLFYCNRNTNIKILNNIFSFEDTNSNRPLILCASQSSSSVRWIYKGNKFIGLSGYVNYDNAVTTSVANNTLVSDESQENRIVKTSNDLTFNANDIRILSNNGNVSVSVCIDRGTSKSTTFETGSFVGKGYYGYVVCSNYAQVDVGDYITPKTSVNNNFKVIAKLGSKLYVDMSLNTVFTNLTFNQEVQIVSMPFRSPAFNYTSQIASGLMSARPLSSRVKMGYQYYPSDSKRLIVCSEEGTTPGYVYADGSTIGAKRSGTFAQKPSSSLIYVGYRYFCTDKQTTEGTTNGIEIIHKGEDVWVDALGRVVS